MARPKKQPSPSLSASAWINRNFRIKVYGRTADGSRVNTLVGVAGASRRLDVRRCLQTQIAQGFAGKFLRQMSHSRQRKNEL